MRPSEVLVEMAKALATSRPLSEEEMHGDHRHGVALYLGKQKRARTGRRRPNTVVERKRATAREREHERRDGVIGLGKWTTQ